MTQLAPHAERSRWPHIFALVLACATFPLIWVGGLVTSYDAGMAVPDWPTTFGYNMFLYPISTWIAGPWDLFIEHGHRLLGSLAGLLTIALNVVIWKYDQRKWMRFAGLVALILVISQGMLGGLRVRLSSTDFARAHGVTGPLFFAFTVVMCVFTSKFWSSGHATDEGQQGKTVTRRVVVDGWLLFALAYSQLVLGAHLRHPNVDWSPGLFRSVVIFHLIAAFVVLLQAGQVVWRSWRLQAVLRRPAWLLMFLVACQIGLGFATWRAKYGWPSFVPVAEAKFDQPLEISAHRMLVGATVLNASMTQALTVTGHVALGSLILATSVLYATRATYCYARKQATVTTEPTKPTERPVSSTFSMMGGIAS